MASPELASAFASLTAHSGTRIGANTMWQSLTNRNSLKSGSVSEQRPHGPQGSRRSRMSNLAVIEPEKETGIAKSDQDTFSLMRMAVEKGDAALMAQIVSLQQS